MCRVAGQLCNWQKQGDRIKCLDCGATYYI